MNSVHLTPMKIKLTLATAVFIGSVLPVFALRPDHQSGVSQDALITQLNAQLLEEAHYSHRRLDSDMAEQLLEQYLDDLDSSRELFLQSDVDSFRHARPDLAGAIRYEGDTGLARDVFDRYLMRIEERADFVERELAEKTFDFTDRDRYNYDRKDAPRPRDAAAARELWRQRLRADVLQEKLADKKPGELKKNIARRYRRQSETMKKLSADSILEMYLNALAHVYDPHSDYMGKDQLESFNISMKLSLVGIGAVLQDDGDYSKITSLIPGGPAARSGKISAGDRITAVTQGTAGEPVDLLNFPLMETVNLVRGPKGSDVTLTIIPVGAGDDVRQQITIRRDEVHLEDQEAKARIIDFPSGDQTTRLGVIDLPAFYSAEGGRGQSATADVAKLINKLKSEDVRGMILDLRHNGGGSLQEAIDLTGLFIPSGAVVQTRDLSGRTSVGRDEDGRTLYDGPLVVLTSRFSASASEIVAGALQDYGRALIVGDTSTFGKGTVQTILSLGDIMKNNGISAEFDPGALKVTISKFYRPGGASTQLRGVRPDIVLPSLTDDPDISEAGMDNAMEWDAVAPAAFPRYDLVDRFVPRLKEKSEDRIATDNHFSTWLNDLSEVKKSRADKSISLNEVERRTELEEAKTRKEAREAARLARAETRPPAYAITLKDTAKTGLPEPAVATPTEPASDDILLEETQRILRDYIYLLDPGEHSHRHQPGLPESVSLRRR
jgi:carboxyl-terminal processing protease